LQSRFFLSFFAALSGYVRIFGAVIAEAASAAHVLLSGGSPTNRFAVNDLASRVAKGR
jgi:hypothetical protein